MPKLPLSAWQGSLQTKTKILHTLEDVGIYYCHNYGYNYGYDVIVITLVNHG